MGMVDSEPSARVLVVHADPAVRAAVRTGLAGRAEVQGVDDDAAAAEVLGRQGVDVVLRGMAPAPDAEARAARHRTLRDDARPSVILLAADVGAMEVSDALTRGRADDCLALPFHPVELRARVSGALRLRAARRRAEADARALARQRAARADDGAWRRSLMDTVADAVLVVGEDGLVRMANPAAGRMFGAPATELVRRPLTDLIAVRWPDGVMSGARTRQPVPVAGRGPLGIQIPLVMRVDVMDMPGGRSATIVLGDRGVAVNTEESLRGQSGYVDGLVNSIQDGLLVVARDGHVIQVNTRFLQMTGLTRADAIGAMPPHRWWSSEAVAELPARWREVTASGSGEIDTTFVTAAGERRSVILGVAPLHDRSGTVAAHVATVKDVTERLRQQERIRALAAEQASLRRVAEAVAQEADPAALFALVAGETAELFGAQTGFVWRIDGEEATLVGLAGDDTQGLGTSIALQGDGPVPRVAQTGRAAQASYSVGAVDSPPLFRHGVAAPIHAGGGVWGCLHVASTVQRSTSPFAGTELQISRFADLVGLAIGNAETRRELAERAATDPLTGLLNHRSFHERFAAESERARRNGGGMSLVLIDLDHFKRVNDVFGHPAGDRVLVELARRMREVARTADVLARIGGEEFAWIIPDTDPDGAVAAAERAREVIAADPFPGVGPLTASLGVCSLDEAGDDTAALHAMSDEALYRAKAEGRNRVCRYEPGRSTPVVPAERVSAPPRGQVMRGVVALTRAVEAKDPATHRHGARVAELAVRLAAAMDWPEERRVLLREAALVHDVGKIAVPDALLRATGVLPEEQQRVMDGHVRVGAAIAGEVLDDEQTSWILHHGERWDGGGLPDGLVGARIPEGARILAVADAMDMLMTRPIDGRRPSLATALAECTGRAGTVFDPAVVGALRAVCGSGALRAA